MLQTSKYEMSSAHAAVYGNTAFAGVQRAIASPVLSYIRDGQI
jgi:hypothetical protein